MLEKNKRNQADGKDQDMRGNSSTHAGDSLYTLLVLAVSKLKALGIHCDIIKSDDYAWLREFK